MKVECYEILGYKVEIYDENCKWCHEEHTFETEECVLAYLESIEEGKTFIITQYRRMIVGKN